MQGAGPILIVDDETDLLNLLDMNLRREGFETVTAINAEQALQLVDEVRPALIVLDLMLPDLSGTEVCRRIRSNPATAEIPIIMLTAKGEEIDRVVGFEVGADDYVVKSTFSVREMVLRVRAQLRRRKKSTVTGSELVMSFGELQIDESGHRVFVEGEEISLTATEFKLLSTLAQRAGKVQTRGMLLRDVWDLPPDLNTRTVDTHVKRLREKLGKACGYLETVRGVGYRFNSQQVG